MEGIYLVVTTLKLWDINMDSGPVTTFQVHEYLRPKCCLSGDGLRVATGSYSNQFCVFGCSEGSSEGTTLEASKNPMRKLRRNNIGSQQKSHEICQKIYYEETKVRQVQTPSRPTISLGNLSRGFRRGFVCLNGKNLFNGGFATHGIWNFSGIVF